MAENIIEIRVENRPDKCRVLLDVAEGRMQALIETAKAHIYSQGKVYAV